MNSADSSSDSTTSDSDSLYDDYSWRSREGNICLFCVKILDNVVDALNHCKTDHNFDIFDVVEKYNMTHTDYTQFICFIRSKRPDPSEIYQYNECWKETNFSKVIVKNDLWLINDIIGLKSKRDDPMPKYVNSESGKVVMFVHHFLDLQKRLQELSVKVKEMDREINATQVPYYDSHPPRESSSRHSVSNRWQSEYRCAPDHIWTFGSALASSVNLSRKSVLATGWGSTSLALLALDADAPSATILALDNDEAQLARRVVDDNALSERLSILLQDQSSSHQFDIILSDWMGYFLFFESRLDSVLYARDNILAPNGDIVPSKFTISMFGISGGNNPIDVSVANYNISSWIKEELKKPHRETVKADSIITSTALVYTMDLVTFTKSDVFFETDFVLTCQRESVLNALVGYFEAFVNECQKSPLVSTQPQAVSSRWKQTVFYLNPKEQCYSGTLLNCHIRCSKHPRNSNGFVIDLKVNGNGHSYEFL